MMFLIFKYMNTIYLRKIQWFFNPFSLSKQEWKASKIIIQNQEIQNESMGTRKHARQI